MLTSLCFIGMSVSISRQFTVVVPMHMDTIILSRIYLYNISHNQVDDEAVVGSVEEVVPEEGDDGQPIEAQADEEQEEEQHHEAEPLLGEVDDQGEGRVLHYHIPDDRHRLLSS